MTRRLSGASLPLLALLLLLAGCGAGGFGAAKPIEPKTSISNYVALGDGFVAGPDLGRVTDKSCLRTADNYPVQVARLVGVNTVHDVSCTGAGTRSLTNRFKSPVTHKELPAQLDAITAKTDLVTLGIGLADRGLLQDMFRICVALPCGPDVVSPKPIITQLKLYGQDLTNAVRSIQDKAPHAVIVLVGYPQLMPPASAGSCKKLPRVASAQLDAAHLVLGEINDAIRSAAQQTGAMFVDVAALSQNHTPCDDDPWVNGFQPGGAAKPYHPLAPEQKAVAEAIAAQVRAH
ncbi:MAG: SGNH/GDSL hydrolase family protein [Marmoricola sp.]